MTDHASRLADLRAQMARVGIDAYLVPRSDEYLGEYVPECAERLAWLTGFTGSAGQAAITADKAVVLSDGRYALQLERQVDAALFATGITPGETLSGWLGRSLRDGKTIGYDARVTTLATIAALSEKGFAPKAVDGNLIDCIWTDRPAPPVTPVILFSEAVAGRSSAAKRQDLIADIADTRASREFSAIVLNAPDSIAWLLNIRAADVPHTPYALSTAILHADGRIDWFIESGRIDGEIQGALGNAVRIVPPAGLRDALTALAASGASVLLDDTNTPLWFRQTVEAAGSTVEAMRDPCIAPRACKTAEEQAGIREAHRRDGVALVRFLAWLDRTASDGSLTELDVVEKLHALRAEHAAFRDTSFDTIAGWAENGAIVHYRATPESNRTIAPPGLLLVDSGAQYPDGTTDVTRTIAIGQSTPAMRRHYTLVLKGHIAIATAKFPQGTKGRDLDALARRALWADGLDYAHGTGHGVGCYLSVHETGIGISSRSEDEFRPGMLLSNEPGYYREGAYGIRIENLLLVQEDGTVRDAGLRKRMCFETVTLAPYDRSLIDPALLDPGEVVWLDDYHAMVRDSLLPHLSADDALWLRTACAPLPRAIDQARLGNF